MTDIPAQPEPPRNIDEIKGDLNLFRRLMNCVAFATGIVENQAKFQAQAIEAMKTVDAAQTALKSLDEELVKQQSLVVAARKEAEQIMADAGTEREKILTKAREDAKALVDAANDTSDALNAGIAEKKKQISVLETKIIDLTAQVSSAQKELNDVTGSMEKALSAVKRK